MSGAESGAGVYISLATLDEWREDAEKRAHRADSHIVFAARILRLIDALKAPCGSCHPCNNWANQTWVNAGERLPHVHEWQEMKERAAHAEAALARMESLAANVERKAVEDRARIAAGGMTLGESAGLERRAENYDLVAVGLRHALVGTTVTPPEATS